MQNTIHKDLYKKKTFLLYNLYPESLSLSLEFLSLKFLLSSHSLFKDAQLELLLSSLLHTTHLTYAHIFIGTWERCMMSCMISRGIVISCMTQTQSPMLTLRGDDIWPHVVGLLQFSPSIHIYSDGHLPYISAMSLYNSSLSWVTTFVNTLTGLSFIWIFTSFNSC